MPMSGHETIRVYAESRRTIGLQLRFSDSFGHASLTFSEARSLARLLDEAAAFFEIDYSTKTTIP